MASARLGQPQEASKQAALRTLRNHEEVATGLLPQITHWLTTGTVAKGNILHAGLTQAVSVVRNKAGKRTEFGLPYLLSRLGGGYVFGTLLSRAPDETKMPLHALVAYRERFGDESVPELMVYDRGGYAKGNVGCIGPRRRQTDWCSAQGQGSLAGCRGSPRDDSKRERDDRGSHWDAQKQQIRLQQPQGADLGDASNGRDESTSLLRI